MADEKTLWPLNIYANNEQELAQQIGLRPEVLAFAKLMEANLRKHDATRGKRSWENDSPIDLLARVKDDYMGEFQAAVQDWVYMDSSIHRKEATAYAAHVANFCMMIADVVGGLEK